MEQTNSGYCKGGLILNLISSTSFCDDFFAAGYSSSHIHWAKNGQNVIQVLQWETDHMSTIWKLLLLMLVKIVVGDKTMK